MIDGINVGVGSNDQLQQYREKTQEQAKGIQQVDNTDIQQDPAYVIDEKTQNQLGKQTPPSGTTEDFIQKLQEKYKNGVENVEREKVEPIIDGQTTDYSKPELTHLQGMMQSMNVNAVDMIRVGNLLN